MYKDLLDFLRLRLDILEVQDVLEQIEDMEDIPNVNPHLAEQIETYIEEFVTEKFVNGVSGEMFVNNLDIKELLEDL
jgi:hypothetical protein